MSLVTQGTILEHLGIEVDIAEKLLVGKTSAERRMRRELTHSDDRYYAEGALYDDIKARATTDEVRKQMVEAETLFCVAYALPRTNLAVEEDGEITRDRGLQNAEHTVSEEYRIQRRIDWMVGQAEEILRDILEREDEPDEEAEALWGV